MKTSLIVDLVKLVGLFAGLWALFSLVPFSFEQPDLDVPIEKEEQLGDFIMEHLMNGPGFKELNTPALDSALAIIGERLLKEVDLTDYDYKIKVVNNSEVNAVTLPGGNILIFKGLIEFSEYPEEVAAVLAHEIGHVEHRHVISKLVKEFGMTLVFSVLTGGDGMLLSELGRTMLSTVFDRKQEKEADEYGLELLEKSKISPRSLATFFRRIDREFGGYDKKLELLMTHPHNNSRIKASLEYELPENFESESFDMDWERVKSSIRE